MIQQLCFLLLITSVPTMAVLSNVIAIAETTVQCLASVTENIVSAELVEPLLDFIGIEQNIWNCNNDCICIHGFSNGIWVEAEGEIPQCICSGDPGSGLGAFLLRQAEGCSRLQFRIIARQVCATQETCDADCQCAHDAQNGTRIRNSDGTRFCRCNY